MAEKTNSQTRLDEDSRILSDEDRVLRLVESHGGRVKQSTLSDELAWSHAKVSLLVSSLTEDDKLGKVRIGRHNLLMLPEHDFRE